ncbi:hypothetical protein LDQ30_002972, partial [Listeria monocytogenes]|nr:hypothetical protein [Listeria monocytogenes]
MPDITNVQEVIVPPRNHLDVGLLDIWERVLDIENIGITDNFFEIGGNSISMVKIRTLINKEMGYDISLNDMLSSNSIQMLSDKLITAEKHSSSANEKYPQISHVDHSENFEFPLTEVQTAYFMGRDESFELGGISTHGYAEFETAYTHDVINDALNKVIKVTPMMRAVITKSGNQQILPNNIKYEIDFKDLSDRSENEINKEINKIREEMSHQVFDVHHWPLFEYKMLKVSTNGFYLFISHDMLIMDSASIQIVGNLLFRSIKEETLYQPDIDFGDYVLALEDFKQSKTYLEDKEYWLSQINNFPEAPVLPMKKDISKIDKPLFERKEIILPKNKWSKIKKKAAVYNVSASAIIGSIYAKVLSKYSNQKYFSINTTVFNRLPFHEDIDSVVGDFTSVVLLKVKINESDDFWNQCKKFQHELLQALEHRHFDGIELIRSLGKENNSGNKAVMPVVYTSIILDSSLKEAPGWKDIGDFTFGSGQTSQVYLDFQAYEDKDGLELVLDYVYELFEANIIDNLFSDISQMLDNLYYDKDAFFINCDSVRNQNIEECNKSIGFNNLTSRLYKQVVETPEAIAVKHNGVKYTYDMLN